MNDRPNLSIPSAEDIEAAASELGMTVAALCRRADISAELFYRWKKGGTTDKGRVHSFTTRNLQKLLDALERERINRNG